MAKKTKKKPARRAAARKAAPRRAASRKAAPRTIREASSAALPVSAVAKLATHPDNILATFNAHAALIEMLIANVHVLAVGKPGIAAVRAARDTAKRLQDVRVTDILRRPPGRSEAEYDLMLQLAKFEFRDIMAGVIDRLMQHIRSRIE